MKTTITDVAKQAGVSMKTVSRVLNNEPNVAQATRDRVKAVARDLQYSPNLAARGLASSRSYFIALLYDNPSPSYLTRLQRGAVDACRENGYHLVLEPMDVTLIDPVEIEFKLSRLGVDGVILAPPLSDHKTLRAALTKLGLRVSLIAAQADETAYSVGMDEQAAAQLMTEHLIEFGHRGIGFIQGPSHHRASWLRFEGYKSAMRSSGLTVNDAWIRRGDFTMESGVALGRELLGEGDDRPTAIFASNDDMAAGVMTAAMEAGLRVPDDVSVCGFDNTQIAKMVWPPLTTIAQPIQKMGCLAAKALIKRGEGYGHDDVLEFELLARKSTGAAFRD